MSTDVTVPLVGEGLEFAVILEWKRASGDYVSRGEVLAEMEGEKAVFEVESPADGYLLQLASPGSELPVGSVIARISDTAP